MSYPPPPQQGQNSVGVPRQNTPGTVDPRTYQYRPIQPQVRIEPPISKAPTFGQYIRSDYRTGPGEKSKRWAGRLAFWLGLLAVLLFWLVGGIFQVGAFLFVASAFSVVALFFGLVAFIAGIGRGLGFWGILLALAGNVWVISLVNTWING